MLRRRHKKSRRGCLPCKKRHVKCDERRPACLMCEMSARDCAYAPQTDTSKSPSPSPSLSSTAAVAPAAPVAPAVVVVAAAETTNAEDSNTRHPIVTTPTNSSNDVSLPITPSSNPDLGASPSTVTITKQADEPSRDDLNLEHMELIIHLTTTPDMFSIGTGYNRVFTDIISLALHRSLESVYLLYELLALSARHLAFLHPEKSASYLHQAMTLQTRAVSMFNNIWASHQVDHSNDFPAFLFSGILGHHLLADALAKRDPGGLGAFVDEYVQFTHVRKGVWPVASASWSYLMTHKELVPVLLQGMTLTARPAKGDHCRPAQALIDVASGLNDQEKETCRTTIRYLQIGFDAMEAGEDFRMLFVWGILSPIEFTNMLADKRPEALVIFGYYSLLLHYARSMWQVRDAGVYIFELIWSHLGSQWHHWLEYPREKMGQDLGHGPNSG